MMRASLAALLALGAGAGLFFACSSFTGTDTAVPATDAASDATDAADMQADSAAVGVGSANLIGPITGDGYGDCLGWSPFRATAKLYDAGDGEGTCIMCFFSSDGGTDAALESYVDMYFRMVPLDAGATLTGTIDFHTPPPGADAAPAASSMSLDLFAVDATYSHAVETQIGTSTTPTSNGAQTMTTLVITSTALQAGISQITFRIDGDHAHDKCVAIRRPVLALLPSGAQ